jgi:hypothetical protein
MKSVPLQSLPNVLRPTLTAGHLLHSAESGEVGARGRRLGMAALRSGAHCTQGGVHRTQGCRSVPESRRRSHLGFQLTLWTTPELPPSSLQP